MFFATAGTSFFVGAARPGWRARPITSAAFAGEGWIEVGGLTSLGRISGEWRTDEILARATDDPDESIIPTHQKAERPARTMVIVVDMDLDDAGQLAMLDAEASAYAFDFRIVLPNGAARMFIALVVAAEQVFEDANSAASYAFSLILQSTVTEG